MTDRLHSEHLSAERMQAFLDGELPAREHASVEGHLAACARCSAEVDGWRVLFEDLGELRSLGPADGFAERVMGGVTLPGAGPHIEPELLDDYLDGALPTRAVRRVEEHLISCAPCTTELDARITLHQRLDTLGRFTPAAGFAERVMSGVEIPERRPLVAGLRALLPRRDDAGTSEHVPAGILQDFVDGTLPSRALARVEAHLGACAACSSEAEGWRTVVARLDGLDRPTPSDGFGERVMAEVRIRQAARDVAPVTLWWRAGAVARRLVPQSRRAWAALSGAAVTPAVIAGLVAWAVFSHPTVTAGSLASFVLWQAADLAAGTFAFASSVPARVFDTFGAGSLLGTLASAPLAAAGVVVAYTALCALALRVLYRNLFMNRSLRGRYAHAFFAW